MVLTVDGGLAQDATTAQLARAAVRQIVEKVDRMSDSPSLGGVAAKACHPHWKLQARSIARTTVPMRMPSLFAVIACAIVLVAPLSAQTGAPAPAKPPAPTKADATRASAHRALTTQPTLYTGGYAPLDPEWRWEYPQ